MKVHKGNRDGGYWQPKEPAEENLPQVPRHKNKKDTKRWCLGKVGREHAPIWVPKFYHFGKPDVPAYFEWACSKCRKVLKTKWNNDRRNKP